MRIKRALFRLLFPLATLAIAAAPVVGEPLNERAGLSPMAEATLPAAETDSTGAGGAPGVDMTLRGVYAPVLTGGIALESSRSIIPVLTAGLAIAAIATPAVLLPRIGTRGDRVSSIADGFHSAAAPISPGDPGDGGTIEPIPLDPPPYEPPVLDLLPIDLPGLDPMPTDPPPIDPPLTDPGTWAEQSGPGPSRSGGQIPEGSSAALVLSGLAALGLSLKPRG